MKNRNINYSFQLEHHPKSILQKFFFQFFSKIRFNESAVEDLRNLAHKGVIIFASKYPSQTDYLLCHWLFMKNRIPYPKISFNVGMISILPLSHLFQVIKFNVNYFFKHYSRPDPFKTGFYKKAIAEEGVTSFLPLEDPKGFTRHFLDEEKESLQFLIETQETIGKPIFIVPLLILYSTVPEKEKYGFLDFVLGERQNPGLIRKAILFLRGKRSAFVDFAEPVNLYDYIKTMPEDESLTDAALRLKRMLIDAIDWQKRVVIGPALKSRQHFKEVVLTDPDILSTITEAGKKGRKQLRHERKQAEEYFDEIASDYNHALVKFGCAILSKIIKRMFEGIDVDSSQLDIVREKARKRKSSIVYVPSHKSHMDYLVLSYVLFDNHFNIPRKAAGNNLAFWPMGTLFRKCGAFFIRRSFKGARLYAKVFSRYIKALVNEGYPIEFYIEGGRSRSGKLIAPKTGFLGILIDAYNEGYCDDMIFVPTSICYDRIIEEKSYIKEIAGHSKENENFKQILKARHLLNIKYGKIYLRFDKPLSAREYFESLSGSGTESILKLANKIANSINNVSVVTPLSILSSAILSKHRRGFIFSEILMTSKVIFDFLRTRGINMAASLSDFETACLETLDLLASWKVLNSLDEIDGEESFYYVDDSKKPELEYYKNSIIHFFLSHAFVAVSLLNSGKEMHNAGDILNDYDFMRNMFRYEFVFSEENSEICVYEALKYFEAQSYIVRNEDNSNCIEVVKKGFEMLPVWAGLIKTFLESYWIAIQTVIRQNKTNSKGDLVQQMYQLGLRYQKLSVIEHVEALSHITFKNARTFLKEDILSEQEDFHIKEIKLSDLAKKIYSLANYQQIR